MSFALHAKDTVFVGAGSCQHPRLWVAFNCGIDAHEDRMRIYEGSDAVGVGAANWLHISKTKGLWKAQTHNIPMLSGMRWQPPAFTAIGNM